MGRIGPVGPASCHTVSKNHTHGRSPPRRVRAVMEWLTEVISPLAPSAHDPRGQRVANGATDTRPSQTSAYILKSPASDHTG